MTIDIITTFPAMFTGFLGESMIARAMENGILAIRIHDLRDFTDDPHRTVDDTPFGGGGGMILKAEPIVRAVEHLRRTVNGNGPAEVVIPTARGHLFNQRMADDLATRKHLIFVCGHYTGIDERIFDYLNATRICIGDYVLTGGELPVMVIADAVSRRLPGFLGNDDSGREDSFVVPGLGFPQYTRPQEWRGLEIPSILISGHHANVQKWRREQAIETTRRFRPELLNDITSPSSATGNASPKSSGGKAGARVTATYQTEDKEHDHD
ncbi:MAG: tRNA (guanosine(37)-N1)-methyltransferase TrmD [Candidatus Zixiibacteriota bacterium]